ncbi:MAG: hypothetical protein REH79_03120 [Spiroplasma sp.]|nr:hypothetical protein [Spiroplasma sp.]
MLKKIITTIAITVLSTGLGLNLIPNPELSKDFSTQNIDKVSPQDLSFNLNNDLSDIKLTAENSDRGFIITFNFWFTNPWDFNYIKNDYTSSNMFLMQWGSDTYNYNNKLFQDNKRRINIVQHAKITTTSEIRQNVNTLMVERESSGLAKAAVAFFDGFTYYQQDGMFYVQWLLLLESNAYNSFSTAFSAISIGSKVTFS